MGHAPDGTQQRGHSQRRLLQTGEPEGPLHGGGWRELVTPDEVGEIEDLEVSTVLNGEVRRENVVSNMTCSPWFLVSFHSKVMTLLPPN